MTPAQYVALGERVNAQEFDTAFTLDADGTVTSVPGTWTPSVMHDDESDVFVESSDWECLRGMSGQYAYHGAVMHASEYVGAGVARVMHELVKDLDRPITFVITTVEVEPTDDEPDPFPAGWAIAWQVNA